LTEEPSVNPLAAAFIEAAHFTPVVRSRVDLVVIHSMEAPEKPGRARQVADWFAGEQAPQASAHYCVDRNEVIQCVREHYVAWAAPGANSNGIQVELAGYASQRAADWDDEYSAAMLDRAAELVAGICQRWEIPAVLVGAVTLKRRFRGITTHASVSLAFRKSTHTDPGPNFPMSRFVAQVAAAKARL
jgi:N-acetyl-anhydromuramyl-L-alanine amidase AmpD